MAPRQELLDYVKTEFARGATLREIRVTLITNDWPAEEVDEALKMLAPSAPPSAPLRNVLTTESATIQHPTSATLRGPLQLIGDAFRIYKEKFLRLFGIALMGFMLTFAVNLFVQQLIKTVVASSLINSSVIGILIFVIQIFTILSLAYAITDRLPGLGIHRALINTFKTYPQFLWLTILKWMMIAPVGTFVLVAYFFSIFGIAYSESPLSFPPLIRALLSSNWSGFAVVVLIFLGIIFAIKFLVSTCLDIFMFASRGERGMKALYSSSTYVRGIWWPVFGRMLFFLFLTIGALFGLYLIILIAAFSPLVQTNHFIGWGSLVLILLISALFAPLGWSFLFALYEGLHAFRGDLQPQPTGMQRFSYITSVILGVLMVAVLIMVFMWGTIYIENVLQNLISFPITPLPNSDLFIPSFELPSSTSSTP